MIKLTHLLALKSKGSAYGTSTAFRIVIFNLLAKHFSNFFKSLVSLISSNPPTNFAPSRVTKFSLIVTILTSNDVVHEQIICRMLLSVDTAVKCLVLLSPDYMGKVSLHLLGHAVGVINSRFWTCKAKLVVRGATTMRGLHRGRKVNRFRCRAAIRLSIVVQQGFTLYYSYQCPSLEGQSPKQLTNQQTSAIPVNPNNPSWGHYTQNCPREIPPVSYIYIAISYLLILI